jgi:hypothetical protein
MQIDEEGIKNLLVNMVMEKTALKRHRSPPPLTPNTFLHVLLYLRMNFLKNTILKP